MAEKTRAAGLASRAAPSTTPSSDATAAIDESQRTSRAISTHVGSGISHARRALNRLWDGDQNRARVELAAAAVAVARATWALDHARGEK